MTVQVRRIAPDDAERLRGLRLAALADAPDSFWQTVAGETARPLQDWRARARRNCAGNAHATFLLARDDDSHGDSHGDDPVGMVDVYQPSLAPEFRELAAMWVVPGMRGTGAADALLDAAVDWARGVGAVGVRLWVVPTNLAAVRLYTRHGFEPVADAEPDAEPDADEGAGRVYLPMLLALDDEDAASPTFLARARAPWTDESG